MKGFLPDGVFNPFDSAFPNDPGLADLTLVHVLNENEKRQRQQEQENLPGGFPPQGGKKPWEN